MAKYKRVSKKTADTVARMAVKQIEQSFTFKQPRMEECLMNEDLYHGQPLPRLKGRFSVPLPTMGGYIDTLLSKTDENAMLTFSSDDPADYSAVEGAKKIVMKELRRRSFRWNGKNRNQKKQAAFCGVGIGELYAENDPKYRNVYSIIDYLDFGAEVNGGSDLGDHKYCGRINVFKSQYDLETSSGDGAFDYNAEQVAKLIEASDDEDSKKNEQLFKSKVDRMKRYGLDVESHDYVGEKIFNLAWWGVTYKGVRYLVTLDYATGTWVRVVKCKDVTGSEELWPWDAWHTHPDEFMFWSKSPADDIRPVAIGIDILFNQALDNRQKRNFGMRAFDSQIFPNPEELEWRPDGLVTANPGIKQISQGIYEFETPEVNGSIDMIQFMDNFLGTKTGITNDAQGESEEKTVGVYYGNLQQVADRLGLLNKSYTDYYENIGVRMLYGMNLFLDADSAVDMIGLDGADAAESIIDRIVPEWDVEVTGSQAEMRANATKSEKRSATLDKIMNNPSTAGKLNPEWVVRQWLSLGEWEQDEIEDALDQSNASDSKMIGEAERAMQEILSGQTPAINRMATTTFVKHIVRKASSTKFDKDPKKDTAMFKKMIAYAEQHMSIVQENMIMLGREQARQQKIKMANAAAAGGGFGGGPVAPESADMPPVTEDAPPEGTPEGTASRSAALSDVNSM